MIRTTLWGVVFLACALNARLACAQAAWPPDFYNPKPLDGDVLIPLPCGGMMAFREVATPAGPGLLDDRQVVVGNEDPLNSYSEHTRNDYLIGPFVSAQGGRYFLIGKYEVTRDQYAAITAERCASPTPGGMVPAVEIGWFDAVQATFRYNQWLFANARDRLPRAGELRGFARLPTEAEWEFAARGGIAVSEAEFRARLPFAQGTDLARFAWFAHTRSAQGQIRPIGRLQPNPLGLFDMLGNASEIVLDPYRLNHGDRLHGQAGGFVIRGGDFLTSEENIRSSLRSEIPHFQSETGRPVRLRFVGMRLVLSAPVTLSPTQAVELRQAWEAVAQRQRDQTQLGGSRPIDPDQDAEVLLRVLQERTQQPDLQRSLARIAAALADERARNTNERIARETADGRSANAAIVAGANIIRLLRNYDALNTGAARMLATRTSDPRASPQSVQEARELVQAADFNLQTTIQSYTSVLYNTAQSTTAAMLNAQLDVFNRERAAPRFEQLRQFARLFVDQANRYRARPVSDYRVFIQEITASRSP